MKKVRVNIHEAKTHLSRLIRDALKGQEITICKGNEPLVKLTLVNSKSEVRRIGSAKNLVELAPDFDAPLTDFADYIK